MAIDKKDQLDAHLTAYKVAADRYDNIYKSIWTIFSYMTAVSAGILSFGGSRFYGQLLTVLACAPLMFWFYTTYLPLDRYGNACLVDLKRIEQILNDQFAVSAQQFRSFHMKRQGVIGNIRRAKIAIWVFLAIVNVTFFWGLGSSYKKWARGDSLLKETSPQEMTIRLR